VPQGGIEITYAEKTPCYQDGEKQSTDNIGVTLSFQRLTYFKVLDKWRQAPRLACKRALAGMVQVFGQA